MKIGKLILLGIFMILVSCGVENLGQSDCAMQYTNALDFAEDLHQDILSQPDSEGNQQSLAICLSSRQSTVDLIMSLRSAQSQLVNQSHLAVEEQCSADEIASINARIDDRILQLEQDLVEVWNDCEKIYGSD